MSPRDVERQSGKSPSRSIPPAGLMPDRGGSIYESMKFARAFGRFSKKHDSADDRADRRLGFIDQEKLDMRAQRRFVVTTRLAEFGSGSV